MILTVTMNTSIDKLYLMETIRPETVMRVKEVHNTAGGKGLNVSKVAAKLGEPVTAMGFIGGFNGQYLVSLISEPLVRPAFTPVAGETRCCINCWDLSDGRSTEYLEPGEPVTEEDIRRFLSDFDAALPQADAVSISGSVPKGMPENFYCELIRRCRAKGIPVLVDTSGNRLIAAAKVKPAFIKPNEDEIAQLTGRHFSSREETIDALLALRDGGIPYVVLSLGADGALLACGEGVFHGKPPAITPRNTVGCGDSMVAGFAVGFAKRLPILDSFRMALAVSAANALSIFTGDFDPADYAALYPRVSIEKLR
ncbi:MAG: 1-phosphofructokinase family hexose kinase [Clostridia bacterium]|nr:1-phosphofructokinase family hexose kinase [Clostridia bacterium]